MGLHVELVEGVGPVVEQPVRTLADVEALRVPDPDEAFAPLLEAIRIVRGELAAEQAVVGFCGGPFTVAGYLVEGRPSREFALVKALMYSEPAVWHALMEKLADCFAAYVVAQARAGADVVQLFDSWVGALSPCRLRGVRRAVVGAHPRRAPACRRSTSAPARRRCCPRWRAPAAT